MGRFRSQSDPVEASGRGVPAYPGVHHRKIEIQVIEFFLNQGREGIVGANAIPGGYAITHEQNRLAR